MALGRWISRKPAPADTGPHRSAEVDTGAQQVEPVQPSEPEWQPLIVGTIHHPRERAILLVEALVSAGYGGKAVYQGDLEVMHELLCKGRGWAMVSWLAVCRELKRIGLRKFYWNNGRERLTMYEIAAPPTNVTALRKPA